MYKIVDVTINSFWNRFTAHSTFYPSVNIIIGKNGSGKTTFMNILYAVLAVDVDVLADHDFSSATIVLRDDSSTRTIKVSKTDDSATSFISIEYTVSRRKFRFRVLSSDERRVYPRHRNRILQEISDLKEALSKFISLSSLSVYRLRSGDDYEIRDANGTRIISPVDFRLKELLNKLAFYQLSLSQSAREVANKLQKDVLVSILYSKEDADEYGYNLRIDKDQEIENLISAYKQLNTYDSNIQKKIEYHVSKVEEVIQFIKDSRPPKDKNRNTTSKEAKSLDIRPLEASRKLKNIINMSLLAENRITEIFSQINLFLATLKSFIKNKEFRFDEGTLITSNKFGRIFTDNLSSGEKQLLILLIEALLQRQRPHVFLADEPELSLHIEWQRKVIPAVVKLNPNAQVIVATHSPEVAAPYRDAIFNMENLVHE